MTTWTVIFSILSAIALALPFVLQRTSARAEGQDDGILARAEMIDGELEIDLASGKISEEDFRLLREEFPAGRQGRRPDQRR